MPEDEIDFRDSNPKKDTKRSKTYDNRAAMYKDMQKLTGDLTIINQFGLIQGKYTNPLAASKAKLTNENAAVY